MSQASPFVAAFDPLRPPAGLEGAIYAIGNFDGAHRGHRHVIERTRALAARLGRPAAILTFEPHPADYFAGRPVIFRLTPRLVKERAFAALGIDGVVSLTFDAALAALSAGAFVDDVLTRRLGVGGIVIGADFHFGKARAGTPAFLAEAGAKRGFQVEIVDLIADSGAAISSTAIRDALAAGDVRLAGELLGRDYSVIGEVIHGQQLGRTLGVPTANIALEPLNRLRFGIYAVRAKVDGVTYGGVASFGVRPTVDNGPPLLETFLFDFSGDLYGEMMEVIFVDWIRGEEKFDSLEALTIAMQRDVERARAALGLAAAH